MLNYILILRVHRPCTKYFLGNPLKYVLRVARYTIYYNILYFGPLYIFLEKILYSTIIYYIFDPHTIFLTHILYFWPTYYILLYSTTNLYTDILIDRIHQMWIVKNCHIHFYILYKKNPLNVRAMAMFFKRDS